MFVETETELAPPSAGDAVNPTARVVWRRAVGGAHPPGMGLQFLKLDRTSARRIDEFVSERAEAESAARATDVPVPAR